VHLSSGQILFADPTKPWGPDNFPDLPSTSISIGAEGRIEDANVTSIRLTNAISYEPYEPKVIYPQLKKTLQIAQNGLVTYSEPKVGFVSTISAPFSRNVIGFEKSTIGGANIFDVLSGAPDTLTNALGKLDAWITNAFLQQPPTVTEAQKEENSLLCGVRWLNFDTYKVLDKSVPYVSGIIIIIGDPATDHYCTIEITDPTYFPFKTYKNGICSYNTPLVRLRVYSDFFINSATHIYTKRTLASNCIRIVTEKGCCTLPDIGKVIAIDNTDGESTYTTLSVYLPNINLIYPPATQRNLPIQIAYINYTDGSVNASKFIISRTKVGNPSKPQRILPIVQSNNMGLVIERPIYSDSDAYFTEPYFSTYIIRYTLTNMRAVRSGLGFVYGANNPSVIPTHLLHYTTGVSQSAIYTASTQTISLSGSQQMFVAPGAVWGVGVSATNLAMKVGNETDFINISTLFPTNNTPSISSISLMTTNTDVVFARDSTLKTLVYSNGWHTSVPVAYDVLFLSTPTKLNVKLNTEVQWNDSSFPGDRSTMKLRSYFTNIDNNRININTLNISTIYNDFPLNTTMSTTQVSSQLATTVLETQQDVISQKYFYKAMHMGSHVVSTISAVPQSIQFEFTNRVITGDLPVANQVVSSPSYLYITEPVNTYAFAGALYNSTCTSTIQISGLYTPSVNSQFTVDIYGKNFINNFSYGNIAEGSLYLGETSIGPMNYLTSNAHVYNGATPVTSLPFPQNTLLHISSVNFKINSGVYQDQNDVRDLNIRAYPTSTNPTFKHGAYETGCPNIFIDTVSEMTYSSFTNTTGPNGKRLLSLLPRPGFSFKNDILETIDDTIHFDTGECGQGLNTTISKLVIIGDNNAIYVSSSIEYNHKSSISTIYTDMYSRELLYTNGKFMHPAGHNFSVFTGASIGKPNAIYPNFEDDLSLDKNNGYRYATFAFEHPVSDPTSMQYLYVKLKNASNVSSIGLERAYNFFPDKPVETFLMTHMKTRMHAKVIGAYNNGVYQKFETAWLNCFKEQESSSSGPSFNEDKYDIGAAVSVNRTTPNPPYYDAEYQVQLTRRDYIKLVTIIRIGIAQDGSINRHSVGDPLMFDSIQTRYSDIDLQSST
jgi:hypothetical protein